MCFFLSKFPDKINLMMKNIFWILITSTLLLLNSCNDSDDNEIPEQDNLQEENVNDENNEKENINPIIFLEPNLLDSALGVIGFGDEQEELAELHEREIRRFANLHDEIFFISPFAKKTGASIYELPLDAGVSRYAGKAIVYNISTMGDNNSWKISLKGDDDTLTLLAEQNFNNKTKKGSMRIIELPLVDLFNYFFEWEIKDEKEIYSVEYVVNPVNKFVTKKEMEIVRKTGAGFVKVFEDNKLWSTHTWDKDGHGTYNFCCSNDDGGPESGSW